MTYRKAIPVATERPSVSQPKIKENFTQLNDQFGVDHTEFEESTNLGKHKKVTLYEQDEDPSTAADEVVIYAKEGDNGTELFYREESDGAVNKFSSFIKVIVTFDSNAQILGDALNVASVVNLGVGQYRVNFAEDFDDINYSVSGGFDTGTGVAGRERCMDVNDRAVGGCNVITLDGNGGRVNVVRNSLIIFKV